MSAEVTHVHTGQRDKHVKTCKEAWIDTESWLQRVNSPVWGQSCVVHGHYAWIFGGFVANEVLTSTDLMFCFWCQFQVLWGWRNRSHQQPLQLWSWGTWFPRTEGRGRETFLKTFRSPIWWQMIIWPQEHRWEEVAKMAPERPPVRCLAMFQWTVQWSSMISIAFWCIWGDVWSPGGGSW